MKRKFQKTVAFSGALAMTVLLAFPGAAAETKPTYESQVLLENQYDAEVSWNNGAVFIKNGSADSIADQTELKLVKPDGSVSTLNNTQKFDKIDVSLSDSKVSPYYIDSSYLIVGKDGKKALLKDDGSFVGNTVYDDISAATDNFMAVKKDGKYVVQKLDSTAVKEYNDPVELVETDHHLIVIQNSKVIGLFDENLKEIDLTGYGNVAYNPYDGNYLEVGKYPKIGLISDNGKEIVPPEYYYITISTYKGETYLNALTMDNLKTKNTVYKTDGTVFFNTSVNLSDYNVESTGGYIPFCENNAYGVYDLNSGTVVIQPTYDFIMACDGHCFAYELNGENGVETYDGKDIVLCGEFPERTEYSIRDSRIIANLSDKKTAYLYASDTGKLINKIDNYTSLLYYDGILEGMTYSITQSSYTLSYWMMDSNGNEIVSHNDYNSLYPLGNIWLASKDGKVGVIDKNGLPVTDAVYQSMGNCSANNFDNNDLDVVLFYNKFSQLKNIYICTKQNDKFGLLEIAPITYAAGLSLDKTEASLNTGDTLTLKPTVSPADTTNQKITWTSSDKSVATVKDGVVTALKAGTATITAKTEDGGFTAVCTITVTERTAPSTTDTANSANTTGNGSQTGLTDTAATTATTAAPSGSPATGESSLPSAAFALIALSALAAAIVRKRKA